MERPRPDPPNRRVVEASPWSKRWKIRGWTASGIPTPVSAISSRSICLSSPRRRATRITTSPLRVNFRALPTRLKSAWRRRTGSDSTQPMSGAASMLSRRFFSCACGRSSRATFSTTDTGSTGSRVVSSWPASIFEKSMTSFSSSASISPQERASSSMARPSSDSGSDFSRCSTPMTPFIGVRISWLTLARNAALASLAVSAAWRLSSASSRARTSSVMFCETPNRACSPPGRVSARKVLRQWVQSPAGVRRRCSNEAGCPERMPFIITARR